MGTTATDVTEETKDTAAETAEGGTADQIRARIEHTREELGHTIDAIQDKLNPENLKARAAEKIHDATVGAATRAAQKVVDTVADLTPQPRHDDPEFPYGDKEASRQECMAKAKAMVQRNQKFLAAGAAGFALVGLLLKLRGRRKSSELESWN